MRYWRMGAGCIGLITEDEGNAGWARVWYTPARAGQALEARNTEIEDV